MKKVDSIEIPVSRAPLYEAVAMFLSVLAHPDDEEKAMRFSNAYCRETILVTAKIDHEFAWAQVARPVYFEMDEKAAKAVLREGAKNLSDRKAAVVNTWALFDGADPRQIVRALDTTFQNTVEGRALLTNAWLKNNDTGVKNVGTRIMKPSRRVIHAAHAYWKVVCVAMEVEASTEREAEEIIATRPAFLATILELAKRCRRLAPSIPSLGVDESDLIEFISA